MKSALAAFALTLTLLQVNIEAARYFPGTFRGYDLLFQGQMGVGEPVQSEDIFAIKNTDLAVTFVVNSSTQPDLAMFPSSTLVLLVENRRSFDILNGITAYGAKNTACQWGIYPNFETVHRIFKEALSNDEPVYHGLVRERRPFLSNLFHLLVNVFHHSTWVRTGKRYMDLRNLAIPIATADWNNAAYQQLSDTLWTVTFTVPAPKELAEYDPNYFEFRFGLIGWGLGKRHILYGTSTKAWRYVVNSQWDDSDGEVNESYDETIPVAASEVAVTCPKDRGPPGEVLRAFEAREDTVFRFFLRNYSLGQDSDFQLSYKKSPISIPKKGKTGLAHRVLISWPLKTYSIAVHITSLFTNPGETIFAAYVFTRENSPVHMFMKRVTLNRSLSPPAFSTAEPRMKFDRDGELAIYFRKSPPMDP